MGLLFGPRLPRSLLSFAVTSLCVGACTIVLIVIKTVAMLAMQYSIPIAPNLDIDYVRERVESRRKLFDGHPGSVSYTHLTLPTKA